MIKNKGERDENSIKGIFGVNDPEESTGYAAGGQSAFRREP